jgi:predicted RNase H-like HicB family nuclease
MQRTYIAIHADIGSIIKAWVPDFPGVMVPGDRWTDTLTMLPIILQKHVDEMVKRGKPLPTPTVLDLWAVHREYPEALIGFVEVDANED